MTEKQHKKQSVEKESSREKDEGSTERDPEKGSSDIFSISAPSGEKVLPFFDPGEEEFLESQGLKERIISQNAEDKPGLTARDIFGKWGDEPSYPSSYPSAKEKNRRDAEEDEEAVDDVEEELYRSRKHASKKEEKSKKKKEKTKRSLTPPTTSKEKERPLFPGAFSGLEQSPPHRLSASREEFELKMSSLEEMPRYALCCPPVDLQVHYSHSHKPLVLSNMAAAL